MAETTELATAKGTVTSVRNGIVTFRPAGTRYELHLSSTWNGTLDKPVKCVIRVNARKVYTVPGGGNFITPIFGPPRIVQGMVRTADQRSLVLQAGCPIHVELPAAENAIDLDDGPIFQGRTVNVVCEPGARAEFVE